jgi:hypothetical protein
MIVGMSFDFSGKELKEHFEKRAERNKMRAEAFVKELARYKEDEDVPVEPNIENSYSNKAIGSARDTLKGRVKHYKMRSLFFKVAADHVVITEVYRLGEHDLTNLEIVFEA